MVRAMSESVFRVGLVQMKSEGRPDANLRKAIDAIAEAAAKGAQIVGLQELFLTDYFCQSEDSTRFDLAEPIPGPTTEALAEAAAKHGIVLVGSIFEKRLEGVFHNAAPVFDRDGTLLGVYRKMHIPDDPLYYEKFYFTPGDGGFTSFQTERAKVGALICWDQWFPEAARLTAMHGAEVVYYPTAIGWHHAEKEALGASQHSAWETMQRSHAIANGMFVVAVNRVGTETGIEFWGGSFVCDPFGVLLAKASHDREEVLVVECDRSRIADARRNWPFLRDRRIDAYGDLVKRIVD
jgi:N-carbamoylputrescine amidase